MIKTPPISPGVALVWVLQKREPIIPILSQDERRRAARFKVEQSRDLYMFARTQLRIILGAYLKQHPSDVRIIEGSHGKPVVAEEGGRSIHFNISHSGSVVGIAISLTVAIGIDIEMAAGSAPGSTNGCDVLSITKAFLSQSEIEHVNSFEAEERCRIALRYWTIKESCLKALGVGLSLDPRSIELPLGATNENGPVFCPQNPTLTANLCFHSLPLSKDVLGAVTAEATVVPKLVHVDRFRSDS